MLASISSSSLLFPAFLPAQLKVLSRLSSFVHLNPFLFFIPPFKILGRKGRDGPSVFTSSNLLWFCFFFFYSNPLPLPFCGDPQPSSSTSANKRAAPRVKLEQKFKIATCFLTLCCAFLFLGRGGDRNLLPSLRQRTWARSRTANGEHGAVIVIVIVNSPRAAAALAACSAVPRDSKAVTCC